MRIMKKSYRNKKSTISPRSVTRNEILGGRKVGATSPLENDLGGFGWSRNKEIIKNKPSPNKIIGKIEIK